MTCASWVSCPSLPPTLTPPCPLLSGYCRSASASTGHLARVDVRGGFAVAGGRAAGEGERCRRGWRWKRWRRLVELAVALDNSCRSLLDISLTKVVVLLRLDELPPAPYSSVTLFLDGGFIACYPPLPAGREFAGIWLGEEGRELEGLQVSSRKQLLLLLEESCVHVADGDSVVLCYARHCKKSCSQRGYCTSPRAN
jgi:hypothetical protein